MRKFLVTWLILIPLGVIFAVFAVTNRHFVTVAFNPLNSADPSLTANVRLFWVIFAAAILGVIAGGSATWFSQGRWRRAARHHEADARTVRVQLDDIRAAQATASRAEAARLVAPAQGGLQGRLYGASGRDKQGAVL